VDKACSITANCKLVVLFDHRTRMPNLERKLWVDDANFNHYIVVITAYQQIRQEIFTTYENRRLTEMKLISERAAFN
jgi:hypothetical protein